MLVSYSRKGNCVCCIEEIFIHEKAFLFHRGNLQGEQTNLEALLTLVIVRFEEMNVFVLSFLVMFQWLYVHGYSAPGSMVFPV